eukprot:866662-Rhodomonas_salina.1
MEYKLGHLAVQVSSRPSTNTSTDTGAHMGHDGVQAGHLAVQVWPAYRHSTGRGLTSQRERERPTQTHTQTHGPH